DGPAKAPLRRRGTPHEGAKESPAHPGVQQQDRQRHQTKHREARSLAPRQRPSVRSSWASSEVATGESPTAPELPWLGFVGGRKGGRFSALEGSAGRDPRVGGAPRGRIATLETKLRSGPTASSVPLPVFL